MEEWRSAWLTNTGRSRFLRNSFGETTRLGECREVRRKEIRGAAAGLDVGDDPSAPLRDCDHAPAGARRLARACEQRAGRPRLSSRSLLTQAYLTSDLKEWR